MPGKRNVVRPAVEPWQRGKRNRAYRQVVQQQWCVRAERSAGRQRGACGVTRSVAGSVSVRAEPTAERASKRVRVRNRQTCSSASKVCGSVQNER